MIKLEHSGAGWFHCTQVFLSLHIGTLEWKPGNDVSLHVSAKFITSPLSLPICLLQFLTQTWGNLYLQWSSPQLSVEIAKLEHQNKDKFAKQSNKLLISSEGKFCNQYSQSHKGVKQKFPTKIVYSENAFKKKQKLLLIQTIPLTRKEDLKGNVP